MKKEPWPTRALQEDRLKAMLIYHLLLTRKRQNYLFVLFFAFLLQLVLFFADKLNFNLLAPLMIIQLMMILAYLIAPIQLRSRAMENPAALYQELLIAYTAQSPEVENKDCSEIENNQSNSSR